LILSAEEVIECLLKLHSGKISDAVANIDDEFEVDTELPEVVKQLVTGLVARQK
jgi:hypothetical protein